MAEFSVVDLSKNDDDPTIQEQLSSLQKQVDLLSDKHDEVVEMVTRIAKVIGAMKAPHGH